MGIFGGNDDKYQHLEEERVKLWADVRGLQNELRAHQEESRIQKEQIQVLEDALSKKTSDYEAAAKEASVKASEHESNSKTVLEAITALLTEANSKADELRSLSEYAEKIQPELKQNFNFTATAKQDSLDEFSRIEELHAAVNQKVNELNAIYANHAGYVDKITKLEELYTKGNDFTIKIEQFYKNVLGKNEEIKRLYLSIVGYTDKDDKGEEVKVMGLKDELQEQYDELESKADKLIKMVADIELNTDSQYSTYTRTKEAEFTSIVDNWKIEYDSISYKIRELLPEALTAGLSAAYHEKKTVEIRESDKLNKRFIIAIVGLVLVSLIPFVVSIYSWYHDTPLQKVLLDMPRLVLAILPLYIPVLWLAYSANKSLKLSKRLIEEYTHKEVLSKTFEGLSTQIANIQNKKVSDDLKNRLLYNILEVSSENPGKLITDYNKSDHPLMDALDTSVKLGKAIEKIADIPGVGKFAGVLEKRVNRILDEKKRQAETGFEAASEEDEEEKDGSGKKEA